MSSSIRDELADSPYTLLDALIAGDADAALCLLGKSPLVFEEFNFTALHAAVMGKCAAAIPVLAEAGVPVDAALRMPQRWRDRRPLKELLPPHAIFTFGLGNGTTALEIARYAACCWAGLHRRDC